MPLPFRTGTLYDLNRESNKPIYERFGAGMYRPIRNTFPARNSTGQGEFNGTKGSAASKNLTGSGNMTGSQKPEPAKSYSAVIDDDEAAGEGTSLESTKPEVSSAINTEGVKSGEERTGITLNLDSDTLLQGILLSEILGKPVSKRKRGRW